MFKEQGYDEFLAKKVQQGLDDIKNGKIYSLEQCNAEWQAMIEKAEQKTMEIEREVAYG